MTTTPNNIPFTDGNLCCDARHRLNKQNNAMKHRNPLVEIFCLIFLFTASAFALDADTAQLQFENGTFTLHSKLPGKESFQGEFQVLDGLTGQLFQHAEALTNSLFEWKFLVSSSEKLFRLDNMIRNLTERELRLEPGLKLLVPREQGDLFWGGFDVLETGEPILQRLGFKGKTSKHLGGGLCQPFPVAALIAADKTVFLGQFQFDQVSWNGARYRIIDEKSAELQFSQRLVLAPGQTLDFRFIIGLTPRKFACEENVVQAMYDAWPAQWLPVQGQDNRYVWSAHSQYRAWYYKPNWERERRYYAAVDWAFTPYKRAGDHWGKEELWDYESVFPIRPDSFGSISNGIRFDYTKRTYADFHRLRKEIFLKNARDFGYSFYTGMAWCEINLAKEKYPDAINYDTEGGVAHILGPWSTGHDQEIRVFPMGTSYAKVLREDIARLWKELDLPGFAFDCGTPGVNYRGPAVNNPELPGRAWDDKGIFIDELVAVNDLIDFVHQLDPDNPPYVWKNGQGRADYVMIETSIFDPIFRSWMPLTRYNIGMRAAVVHGHGYLIDQTIPNWRNLNQEEFYHEMAKLADHAVLTDFQYGVTQNHVTQNGNPQSIYAMPELIECNRNGWQALIPVELSQQGKYLYQARYGRGASSILYFGNPWPEPMPIEFRVDNSELGRGSNLFVTKMRDQATLHNRVEGSNTFFQDSLPSRRPRLYEAVINLSALPAEGRLEAVVSSYKDINQIRFDITLKGNSPFKAILTPRFIHRYNASILVNGTMTSPATPAEIPANAHITVRFQSDFFHCKAAEILSFPFVDAEGKPAFAIQLPAKAHASELKEAAHLQDYFRFTADQKITLAGEIPVVQLPETAPDPAVLITVGRGEETGITRRADRLELCAADADEAHAMLKEMAYVMDRRFPYIIPFGPVNSISQEMLKKFNMPENPLPFERCFESMEFAQ